MAAKTVIIDDLDGSEATKTPMFTYEGEEYEIDLSEDNAKAMEEFIARQQDEYRDFMKKYQQAGRRVERRKPAVSTGSGRTKEQNDAIRAWARANGHQVNDTGRIPLVTISAYELAQEAEPASTDQVNPVVVEEITSEPSVDEVSTDGNPTPAAPKRRK